MMVTEKKFSVDIESDEYKRGFATRLDDKGWTNPYSINVEYSRYRNWKAGHDRASREVKMYGISRVRAYST